MFDQILKWCLVMYLEEMFPSGLVLAQMYLWVQVGVCRLLEVQLYLLVDNNQWAVDYPQDVGMSL